jgi:selenocysteine lyase/cysteine desulfurase
VGALEDYVGRFDEEPGYLDFARFGPIGAAVVEEEAALLPLLARARFGSLDHVLDRAPHVRVQGAVAALTGFRPDQIVFQPNTSQGLMHAMFGLTGGVALSAAEFPSLTFGAVRASQALGVLQPYWMTTEPGRLTPGGIQSQELPNSVVAVAVSLVDFRTGYLADLEGIKQVIGDRLLMVDATQGFGVVDAPYQLADILVAGGQKWPRSGWGTGFLALSDRALDHLTPVWSGFNATDVEGTPMDEVPDPTRGPAKFQVSNPDPVAQARFAAALEEIASVGVAGINGLLADRVSRIIDLADEFALPVTSPRPTAERAGIVVVQPEPDRLTVLAAALHNHGVTATIRAGHARLSPHASTDDETFGMLRAAFISYASSAS